MKKNYYWAIGLAVLLLVFGAWFYQKRGDENQVKIRVGYPPVSTSLPLFVAINEKLFEEKGLTVIPTKFETANQIAEALVAERIDATSVCADYPLLSVSTQSPNSFKLFAWEMLDTTIPFDMILSKKGSAIKELKDLQGKTIATFPGSQLKHYLGLIMGKALQTNPNITIIEMPPQNQIPALDSGAVDAIFCLEPIGTIAIERGVGQIVAKSPISTYIGDGTPLPAASFAISTNFVKLHPSEARKFVEAMWSAIDKINANQEKYRALYPTFSPITADIAAKVPVTKFAKTSDMDIQLFQKEADILFSAKLLDKKVDVATLVYK